MSKPLHPAETFFVRYNLVIFIVIAALSLAAIIYVCYDTYTAATTPDESATKSTSPDSFDKETAQKIDGLHTPDEVSQPNLPNNVRINPFTE